MINQATWEPVWSFARMRATVCSDRVRIAATRLTRAIVERRLNGGTGPWTEAWKIPYVWPF